MQHHGAVGQAVNLSVSGPMTGFRLYLFLDSEKELGSAAISAGGIFVCVIVVLTRNPA